MIPRLELEDGRETTEENEIVESATSFFKNLFMSRGVAFTEEEVFSTLKEIGATKASGLDGFPAIFFQRYWHIVVVAKTIANRLQGVMEICIDESQSAFIPGRLSDNTLLAYEMLHTFRRKRTGNKGFMAVKLNMSKAYDRVEWDFIKEVMLKMGFDDKWVDLILKCIITASYVVNVNGNRGESFQATRVKDYRH
ncbi:reverse transcriptase [Gossypium australe]|uniref:Reverse transcriptase n=1 Tax=Gossypium australe TaxID=47621 RepID=A0A5B6VEH7_9ROSI|nr:reverse transcriptase [Gossypium australe]